MFRPASDRQADIELRDNDVGGSQDNSFGDTSVLQRRTSSRCKTFPGDPDWPTDDDWSHLNISLVGALLKPRPPASVCYPGDPSFNSARCSFLLNNASSTSFYLDDPLTILNIWPEGNTCLASLNPQGNCTQGGYPVYVVNATTVKQVQIAVNFARNKNLRLIIKNTGHDSVGRNVGAGSLSIWTHNLKSFDFLPRYIQPGGNYTGMAARVGSGLQAWEAFDYSAKYNITLPAASCLTVGSYGGWIAGGGHSPLSSTFGMGADQVLSMQVVTADGRYVAADPVTNSDLFFALRGGGGSTYGIITSAIVKAHPPINLTIASFTFTLGSSTSGAASPSVTISDAATFWAGVHAVYAFGVPTADAGGYLWTTLVPLLNKTSFQMQVRVQMPGLSASDTITFVSPLVESLNTLGIPINIATPTTQVYGSVQAQGGTGIAPGNSRFSSRLFPRTSFTNATAFDQVMQAVRETVEQGGYTFHGLNMAPTAKAAGYPPPAGLNPIWRRVVMHADVFDTVNMGTATPEEAEVAHERLDTFMAKIRAATPGGGAYFNEADLQEPNWQESFFGTNYDRLLGIKRQRDPWQLFWAPTTVGSEGWEVRTADGLPTLTQNGRLCRTAS
ncbi:hypothetical protein QBC46DRAFT_441054 [Diplogelasinospora grovesii]|uniref:FAD-binding PCMH-type domain-containing protein n=1 Tax=Diplogelasinospora grovesii TaxID=303347 RepID=A0AAN6S3C0_9PEZI|nr:hypothetical protein QBC46DRAFT_441054 [Diplogelasinospora grovesii]